MVLVLKTKDILDEKEKILRKVSKEVTFPLTKKDMMIMMEDESMKGKFLPSPLRFLC